MADTAVLVIDMLNSCPHPDAVKLIPNVAERIKSLAYLLGRIGTKRSS
jgi:hypothetical protein